MKQMNCAPAPVAKPCMRCGREASQGRQVTLDVDRHPPWARIGFLFGLLPALALLLATRRPARQFSYSLCPRCMKVRLIKQIIASVAWAGFLGTLIAAILTRHWELWATIAFWLFFVAVFATAASSLRLVREKELYRPRA